MTDVAEMRGPLSRHLEFSLKVAWVRCVVVKRTAEVLHLRRRLRAQEQLAQFQYFESSSLDTSSEFFFLITNFLEEIWTSEKLT